MTPYRYIDESLDFMVDCFKEDEIKSFIRDKENRLKQIENELSKER